jgi:acyl-CoA synthetase (AMP-forming)/AMP-acid ligase II
MTCPLLQRLNRHAAERPHATALVQVETGESWTWRRLERASAHMSSRLSDLPPRSTVMVCGPNEPALAAALLGVLAAGRQAFPISPQSPAAELEALADAAGAVAVIGTNDSLRFLAGAGRRTISLDEARRADVPPPRGVPISSDSALLLHSSGTTGRHNIVRRSIAALEAVAVAIVESIGMEPDDQILAAAPLCHSYGVEHGLLGPLWAGSCAHLCRAFDPPTAIAALDRAITILPGVPFMFELLAGASGPFSYLRRAYSAGGPLPARVAQAFANRHGVRVGQVYGTTEIGSVTFSDPQSSGFNPGSVGRPMRDVSLRIEPQTGQVAVQSASMFSGYMGQTNHDLVLTADGHFLTGDLGSLDEHGNLVLAGRIKLMIEVGGRKVNPLEVESVLCDHPMVGQCVVVPMALSETVTRLKAIVTPRNTETPIVPEELRRFAKQRLSSYKVPRAFEVRDRLPQTPTGKILRRLLQG